MPQNKYKLNKGGVIHTNKKKRELSPGEVLISLKKWEKMQNMWKEKKSISPNLRNAVISIIKDYDERAKYIKEREAEICSVSGGRYESYTDNTGEDCRAFTPGGKGGISAPVEHQADRLAKFHAEDRSFFFNKTIDDTLAALPLGKYDESEKIRKEILNSCKCYRKHPFSHCGVTEISEKTFFHLRNIFLKNLAENLKFI